MTQPAKSQADAAPKPARASAGRSHAGSGPFGGLIDAVIVDEPVLFPFAGSVGRDAAMAAWVWVSRDLCPELIPAEKLESGRFGAAELEPLMPDVLAGMTAALERVDADGEALQRLRVQFGRERAREELAVTMAALHARALLPKAQGFGRAVNSIGDEAALGTALQSMPLRDPQMAALLFHAALGQIANPTRLITAVIRLAGGANEEAVARNGFSPLLDAYLAHAQNQLCRLNLTGPFADIDLACRSLDRFHRLARALTGYIEFTRTSRSTQILSSITRMVSDRVEPRLKEVATDLNQAMRRPREGHDRIDGDRLLGAISGVYLLATVRDCRASLALNAVFDQAWNQTGEALELHIQRNLDLLRQNPDDQLTGARLDAAIKMAEVRFNPDYAETLRRARVTAERRG